MGDLLFELCDIIIEVFGKGLMSKWYLMGNGYVWGWELIIFKAILLGEYLEISSGSNFRLFYHPNLFCLALLIILPKYSFKPI